MNLDLFLIQNLIVVSTFYLASGEQVARDIPSLSSIILRRHVTANKFLPSGDIAQHQSIVNQRRPRRTPSNPFPRHTGTYQSHEQGRPLYQPEIVSIEATSTSGHENVREVLARKLFARNTFEDHTKEFIIRAQKRFDFTKKQKRPNTTENRRKV